MYIHFINNVELELIIITTDCRNNKEGIKPLKDCTTLRDNSCCSFILFQRYYEKFLIIHEMSVCINCT